jgi:HK97 family phage portal protein
MSLKSKLKRLLLRFGPKKSAPPSPIQAWLQGEDWHPLGGSGALASPYQQSVWVYTAVSALAQTVSAMPFRISRGDRSGENIMSSGPAVALFNQPHPYLNRFRFWEFIVTWYCLRGETFVVALDKSGKVLPIRNSQIRNSQSAIRNLLVLNPDHFRHVIEGYDLIGWRYMPPETAGPTHPLELLPDEVIHDFMPNPYLFWRGLSPLSVAMLAAQTDYASAQFMKGLMLNNADTGVIVRTDQQLSAEQREQLSTALRQRKASAGTADRPLLLWGGAEVVNPTLSSADMQFMDNRKLNRQEICAAFFRMPQSLIGFTENANRAIAESERLNFIENSIMPLCARLEAALDPVVKSFGRDLVGWFDVESTPILQAARRSRVETALKLFAMGYPANLVNRALDLGMPHLPWGDKGYLPANLQEVGAALKTEN